MTPDIIRPPRRPRPNPAYEARVIAAAVSILWRGHVDAASADAMGQRLHRYALTGEGEEPPPESPSTPETSAVDGGDAEREGPAPSAEQQAATMLMEEVGLLRAEIRNAMRVLTVAVDRVTVATHAARARGSQEG